MHKSLLSTLAISCIILFSSSLVAGGLGIAFTFGFGTTDYDWYEADANNVGINFVYDSNVAKRSLFNYRLTASIEDFKHEYEFDEYYDPYIFNFGYSDSHAGRRFVTDHAFGFGIVKSSVVRLWMGPNIRFGFVVTGNNSGYTVGAGLTALGLNFNMGRVFTLALEVGYLYNTDQYSDSIDEHYYINSDIYESIDSGSSKMFVVKLFILFRINDTYDDIF